MLDGGVARHEAGADERLELQAGRDVMLSHRGAVDAESQLVHVALLDRVQGVLVGAVCGWGRAGGTLQEGGSGVSQQPHAGESEKER